MRVGYRMRLLGLSRLCRRAVARASRLTVAALAPLLAASALAVAAFGQTGDAKPQVIPVPPRAIEAQRFLAARGWTPGHRLAVRRSGPASRMAESATASGAKANGTTASSGETAAAAWQPLGPAAVSTPTYGLVTGRISALALDPSDSTGNHLYVGTTGGGVWEASNAGASGAASVEFTPLTDAVNALGGAADASISVGALAVQPGGTGVILAGTGDPNDVLDSYYGAGILRSTDGGTTWTLIQETRDAEDGLSGQDYAFVGEGFAGFAWSTANPQVAVAAVSQAYEGTLVDSTQSDLSYEGLYYSADSGATWHLALITDGSGKDVQGPLDAFAQPDGNAATAVVWNPVRQVFVAAVRFHGYYQSPDGVTWTRIATQPGTGLAAANCPNNLGSTGSIACPILRGALAVNPTTGDTFAWTVDIDNQDQGLWQDQCGLSNGVCGNGAISFSTQWSTASLETSTIEGAATIPNGNYNLTLAAVPSQQDTLLVAGDNDLWKCSLAAGCVWRDTTNATTCMSAQVGEFQHALVWNAANPLEIFAGNDSGLWRSLDAIGETGPACSTSDASHFQNLNGDLGSLAEVVSLSPVGSTPYTMMAGLGVNGTAGVKGTSATTDWPQILSGYGGPVATDPGGNWYVNNEPGVSIYECAQPGPCTSSDFGTSPVVTNADVDLPAGAMAAPAAFAVDPLDPTQLLIATCQLWRGPANGTGWSAANAVTAVLDSGAANAQCNGDAAIRSISAMALAGGGEIVYLGMYGQANGGANLPGHVLSVVIDGSGTTSPIVTDLTFNPVVNDSRGLNYYGLDISSVFADPHDPTGQTVYVTVEGVSSPRQPVQTVYGSTDGGAHWTVLTANLPAAPANSLVVDPANANTVYVATDQGVYFAANVASCTQAPFDCWSLFGTGLPDAPAVQLSAAPAGASEPVLVAATYGRGIWQTPLWSAGTTLATVTADPPSLSFGSQTVSTASTAQTVKLENAGAATFTATAITVSGAFTETDGCVNTTVPASGSCDIDVTFAPTATGDQTGQMIVEGNVAGGQLTIGLSGTGTAANVVTVTPDVLSFAAAEEVGQTSASLPVSVTNSSSAAVPITSIAVSGPFAIASNACGTTQLAASAACQIEIAFAPAQAGPATGALTLIDGAGTQTVALTGTGVSGPTDTLSTTSLTFPATATGQSSAAQNVTITNSGGLPLESISAQVSSGFALTNRCGAELAAGASCSIAVEFVPAQQGSISGTLTLTDALRQQSVSLAGTGVAPAAIGVSPLNLTFANQQPGVASQPQTVTVTNSGGAPMANVGFAITGPAAASYSLAGTSCGAVLNNGASCAAQIVFIPAATGAIAATLVVSSSTTGVAPVSVSLGGAGQLAAALGTNPSQVQFASVVGVGQSSTAQMVTVTNTSSYAIAAVAVAVTAPFTLAQNNCTGALAAGGNCSAAVAFTPTAAGPATGALTVSSAAVAAPANVALTGTGFDFAVSASGPAGVTVSSGQTANFALVITPNGSQGIFAFSCGALPANAVCSFNPGSETLSAGVQGNVTVEIATGQSSAAARASHSLGWGAAPLVCAVLLAPFARARKHRFLLLVAFLGVLAAGVSSCTSSGGGTGGSPPGGNGSGTPAGTYTIPVSVSSTGVSHGMSLTLTVD